MAKQQTVKTISNIAKQEVKEPNMNQITEDNGETDINIKVEDTVGEDGQCRFSANIKDGIKVEIASEEDIEIEYKFGNRFKDGLKETNDVDDLIFSRQVLDEHNYSKKHFLATPLAMVFVNSKQSGYIPKTNETTVQGSVDECLKENIRCTVDPDIDVHKDLEENVRDNNAVKNNVGDPENIFEAEVLVRDYCQKESGDLKRFHISSHLNETDKHCTDSFSKLAATTGKSFFLYSTPVLELESLTTTRRVKSLFTCDFCDKNCRSAYGRDQHVRTHTREKPFTCDLCNKSFRQNSHLTQHIIVAHSGEKPFKCEICNKTFSYARVRDTHIRIHTGEKPFKCKVCSKSFNTTSGRDKHKLTHSGEKSFQCDICKKNFRSAQIRETHYRTHTGEKPYKCKNCSKSFSSRGGRDRHSITHTEEKPFQCDVCNKSFRSAQYRDKHCRNHTGGKCKVCGKRFGSAYKLASHVRTHNGETHQYRQRSELKKVVVM